MSSRSISKRTFLKSIGFFALLGVFAPWFRKIMIDDYPVKVRKEPNAIPRIEI